MTAPVAAELDSGAGGYVPDPVPASRVGDANLPNVGSSPGGHVSWDALERWMTTHEDAGPRSTPGGVWEHSLARHLADRLGLTPSTTYRWQRAGRLHRHIADVVAIQLGVHPLLIWADWLADIEAVN